MMGLPQTAEPQARVHGRQTGSCALCVGKRSNVMRATGWAEEPQKLGVFPFSRRLLLPLLPTRKLPRRWAVSGPAKQWFPQSDALRTHPAPHSAPGAGRPLSPQFIPNQKAQGRFAPCVRRRRASRHLGYSICRIRRDKGSSRWPALRGMPLRRGGMA